MPATDTSGGTYSGDPSSDNVSAVRFEIGDTKTSPQQRTFTDDEVGYVLAQEKNNVLKAAARLAEVAAARVADKGESGTAAVRLNKVTLYKKYIDLANRLRARAATAGSFITNRTTQNAKDLRTSTSLRQPKFRVGMNDHFQVLTPEDESGV